MKLTYVFSINAFLFDLYSVRSISNHCKVYCHYTQSICYSNAIFTCTCIARIRMCLPRDRSIGLHAYAHRDALTTWLYTNPKQTTHARKISTRDFVRHSVMP